MSCLNTVDLYYNNAAVLAGWSRNWTVIHNIVFQGIKKKTKKIKPGHQK